MKLVAYRPLNNQMVFLTIVFQFYQKRYSILYNFNKNFNGIKMKKYAQFTLFNSHTLNITSFTEIVSQQTQFNSKIRYERSSNFVRLVIESNFVKDLSN
jgi:hypothetical protein